MGFSIQHDNLPSPQPPASIKRSPESSLRGRRIRQILEEDNRVRMSTTHQTLVEEDPFFEKKLRLGSQMTIVACKMAKLTAANRSPSPDSSLINTPTELRAISHLGHFTPTPPPPRVTRRPSCRPMMTMRLGGKGKEVAEGCKLQSAQTTLEEHVETLEKFKLGHCPSPKPPAALCRTFVVVPKVPGHPSKAALPNRGGLFHGTPAVAPKFPAPPSKAAPPNRKGPRRGTKLHPTKAQEDLQPLVNPTESLSLCFTQLNSEDWKMKLDGLKSVRALA
ncbi:uncharacterized protein LOC114572328 [Perca flavescens]|uniref:uncharacterized protein LOC114572328 n=1 Tax=Perca flavescens TaxID=8167 RepID=UPI00106DF03E|nr:uncharacterized protein LOC114572328 [Perca flavescens]